MAGNQQIIVVGAGIAGLTAAFRLKQSGFSVRVLEASNDVGGRMATLSLQDYRIDLAVSVFPDSYGCLLKLIDAAGLANEVAPTSDWAGVVRDGRVHRTRGSSKLDGVMTGLLSWGSKLLLVRALIDAARAGDKLSWENLSLAAEFDTESAAVYARRRLNEELLEYLVEPICRVFCLAPAAQVSAVNFLFVLHHFVGVSFFNSGTGVDFLPRGLARQLDVSLNATVSSVRETAAGVEVVWSQHGQEHTDLVAGCVIGLPAPQMLAIYPTLDPQRREMAAGIHYSRPVGVHLGLSKAPDNEPCILLQLPGKEHPDLAGIILEHNKAPGRVPAGKGMLSTLWLDRWAARQWERDDKDIIAEAIAGVGQLLPNLVTDVECAHVQRWQFGPDLPHPGVHRSMQPFQAVADPKSRIRLAGDYMSSASSNASAVSAEKAARELAAVLGG